MFVVLPPAKSTSSVYSVATQELYRMELMLPYTIVNLPKHAVDSQE